MVALSAMKVLIISGGSTSERKISLISAKAVQQALKKSNYSADIFDLKNGRALLKTMLKKYDVVFPVLHGAEGEGGELQGWLKDQAMPYVGGDPKGFKEGFNKVSFKKFCGKHKFPTAKWKLVKTAADIIKFGFPAVLKNSEGGSSREVVILKSQKDLKNSAAKRLLKLNTELFIEQYLEGVEVTVGVLSDQVMPVIEIIPPAGSWFDYKNKYSGATQEIPNAPSLTEEQRLEVQSMSLQIHQMLKLGTISRTDFIISDGKPYILEVNTIPGMTSGSLFPKAALAAGISFEQLVDKLVQNAVKG